MSGNDRTGKGRPTSRSAVRKPPPRWRRYLVQAELELPPPEREDLERELAAGNGEGGQGGDRAPLPWWQARYAVLALAAICCLLLLTTAVALFGARRDRQAAAAATASVKMLTLRASTDVFTLRIAPNQRSWSAAPDAILRRLEPPEMLDLYLSVGYSNYQNFAVTVDKVDHGRVLVVQRLAPDSNRDLRLAINSSALGPGEYRIHLQGHTWRGERRDVGWVRLSVS